MPISYLGMSGKAGAYMTDQTDPQPTPSTPRSSWWSKTFKRADIISTVITLMLIVVGGVVFAWLLQPPLLPSGDRPVPPKPTHCASATRSKGSTAVQPVKVSDASGTTATLSLYISRVDHDKTNHQTQPTTKPTTKPTIEQTRQSIPLAIQKAKLCAGEILAASIGDLARSDGQTLPTNQVAVWGEVDSTGTHVIIWVKANPRYGYVSGFGSYSGIASLNDSHAVGGNVPVAIHVLYPNVSLVLVAGFLAAFGGFIWAWLVHDLRQDPKNPGDQRGQKDDERSFFWRNLILRMAVLLVATIPVVNVQVLANPDWSGDLSQYIALATLAGGAAIALTPTFRALALRPGLSHDSNEGGS